MKPLLIAFGCLTGAFMALCVLVVARSYFLVRHECVAYRAGVDAGFSLQFALSAICSLENPIVARERASGSEDRLVGDTGLQIGAFGADRRATCR